MESLLHLCVQALGQVLCWGTQPVQLELLPEMELVLDVWTAWQRLLIAAASGHPSSPPPSLPRQQKVLAAFAAAFWHPQLLRLAYPGSSHAGLSSLPLISQRLLHLELAAPALRQLDVVAVACCQLRCLSLRGCTELGDASLAALPQHLTQLQAVDLGDLAALTDGACFHLAKLPALEALNLSGTAISNMSLELLTYGHKVRAWQHAEDVAALPPEAAVWPAIPLEHVQLAGTRAGAAGAAELARLPHLRFLDMRHTGVPRPVLASLQHRFALQFVQAAVLSSSNIMATAVVNQNAVLCRCGQGSGGSQPGTAAAAAAAREWEAAGVQLLLHSDPTSGLGTFIDLIHQHPKGQADRTAAATPPVGLSGGRRIGYRQPRPPLAAAGGSGWPQPSGKRKWVAP